jgi:hypothetical protein
MKTAKLGIIEQEPVNYKVDADIKGFFDHVTMNS